MKKHTIKIRFGSEKEDEVFVEMNRITVKQIESAIKVLEWHKTNAYQEPECECEDTFSPGAEAYVTDKELKKAKKFAKKMKKGK
jgi:hypothetical protein